jgi:8-oxo-dGTP diphosphatase
VITVTRAIVVKQGRVLAAQRTAEMSLPLKWELPGGKCEPGEGTLACVVRETQEELGYRVLVVESLDSFETQLGTKQFLMVPFVAVVTGGHMQLSEHADAVWQPIPQLMDLDWAPAERRILEEWLVLTSARKPEEAASSL